MLTRSIEKANNRYLNRLRMFQFTLLVLVLVSSMIAVVLFYTWTILPPGHLQKGMNTVHDDKLGVQVPTDELAEFAKVDKGFNRVSSRLHDLYRNLEQEVADRTHDLAAKNCTLETLYALSSLLSHSQSAAEAAEGFLGKMVDIIPADAGNIRLIDFQRRRMDLITRHGLPDELQNAEAYRRLEECSRGMAVQQSGQTVSFYRTVPPEHRTPGVLCSRSGYHLLRVFKISNGGINLGLMTLCFKSESDNRTDVPLVELLCHQLGVTVSSFWLGTENRQPVVLQERNLATQGLHDSIARIPTLPNLQIQTLERALEKSQRRAEPEVAEKLRFIRKGVQKCYNDVRELPLNFRIKITHNEFNEAAGRLVLQFKQQAQIEVETHWLDDGPVLTLERQLQSIFILQKSLSNTRKHTRARRVTVTLYNRDDFKMEIEDDDYGFNACDLDDSAENGHVGLNIMSERTHCIRTVLEIMSEAGVGTEINLTLPKGEGILE